MRAKAIESTRTGASGIQIILRNSFYFGLSCCAGAFFDAGTKILEIAA
jgi:hypothetical protein